MGNSRYEDSGTAGAFYKEFRFWNAQMTKTMLRRNIYKQVELQKVSEYIVMYFKLAGNTFDIYDSLSQLEEVVEGTTTNGIETAIPESLYASWNDISIVSDDSAVMCPPYSYYQISSGNCY